MFYTTENLFCDKKLSNKHRATEHKKKMHFKLHFHESDEKCITNILKQLLTCLQLVL